jgi:hypothetical protein
MLKGGLLQVEGMLRPAFTKSEGWGQNGMANCDDVFRIQKNGQVEKIGEMRFDVPLCEDCAPRDQRHLIFLLCCLNSNPRDGGFTTHAIALQLVDLLQLRFRRVGLAWSIKPELWNEATSCQMIIE